MTRRRIASIIGRLLVLMVFLAAAWLLCDRLKGYTFQEVRDAITGISVWHIAVASLLTVVNYVILVGYDWLAVRWVGETQLPLRKIAQASFVGYAFSYNFGATLFGTSVRYRLYSMWGVSLRQIFDLLVILGLTFWFGVFLLAGVVFVVAPLPLPAELEHLHLPIADTFWLGATLLSAAALYVLSSALLSKPHHLFGRLLPLPPLRLTIGQLVIACGDMLVAVAVLYALLPPIDGGYLRVLGFFLLAYVAAIVTHVPGGYGVFDALIMSFMAKENGPSVLAALLVFRMIYYWTPLFLATVLLGCNELAWISTKTEKSAARRTGPNGVPEGESVPHLLRCDTCPTADHKCCQESCRGDCNCACRIRQCQRQ